MVRCLRRCVHTPKRHEQLEKSDYDLSERNCALTSRTPGIKKRIEAARSDVHGMMGITDEDIKHLTSSFSSIHVGEHPTGVSHREQMVDCT